MTHAQNIVLMGFMGTGKSSTGRSVAETLRRQFIDMDEVLEARAGKAISAIFAEDGEPAFRRMEHELVLELADQHGLVIAAGGGVVLNPENVAAFTRSGQVFCLTAPAETILKRVAMAEHRPLLEDGDKAGRIRDLLARRKALYDALPHQVETDHLSPEAVADRVLEIFRQAGD